MIGAAVFLIFFALFLVLTISMPGTPLPPGSMIHDLLGILRVDTLVLGIPSSTLTMAIVNGVVYGVIVWFVFSLVKPMLVIGKPRTVEYTVTLQEQDTERDLSPPDAHEDVTLELDADDDEAEQST